MNYQHLLSLVNEDGIYQHCDGLTPIAEHGYRVEDAARALIVIERDRDAPPAVRDISQVCMDFLAEAQSPGGSIVSRRSLEGEWHGENGADDHWGLAMWAWGTVVGRSENLDHLERAIDSFHRSAHERTPFLRPMAFAALGAAEYLSRFPFNEVALDILCVTRDRISHNANGIWPWPENRLTYVNALLPHALILAGHHLGDRKALQHGLTMLTWLVELQTRSGHLAPIGGWGWSPGEDQPTFNQQPIEVAHLVEACLAAYTVTQDPTWLEPARLGGLWFYGLNDSGVWMHDPQTGGGYDGLHISGRKDDRGAESTLAYLSTLGQLHLHREFLEAARQVS